MDHDRDKTEHADETRSVRTSEITSRGGRSMRFDWCGPAMGREMAGCPCSSIARKHPFVTSAMLALMGLAALVIPAGAILGIIAFFRTI